jgi:hypothetical protein
MNENNNYQKEKNTPKTIESKRRNSENFDSFTP